MIQSDWELSRSGQSIFSQPKPIDLNAASGVTTFIAASGATITVTATRDPSSKDGLVINLIETAAQDAASGGSAIFASVKSSASDPTLAGPTLVRPPLVC